MSAQLAYSIHLGSDKNRTTKAKGIAKSNPSGATSFSNNAIQSKAGLSKANKHNLRDYDRKAHEIEIVLEQIICIKMYRIYIFKNLNNQD